MLYADKRALQTNLKVSLLAIRERELVFYTHNSLAIGTQAAMFAGFAFAGLTQPLPEEASLLRAMFLVCNVSSLGLQLITMVSTTLLSMLAPGLALRGPDGSMHTAVDGMVDEYRRSFYCFILGMVCTHGAAVFFVWMAFPPLQASVLTVCVLTSLGLLYRYIRRLMLTFAIAPEALKTGKFEGEEIVRTGCESGVRDSGEVSTLSTLITQQQHLSSHQRDSVTSSSSVDRGLHHVGEH